MSDTERGLASRREFVQYREFFAAQKRLVGAAHAGGVGVIGGTDCLNPTSSLASPCTTS